MLWWCCFTVVLRTEVECQLNCLQNTHQSPLQWRRRVYYSPNILNYWYMLLYSIQWYRDVHCHFRFHVVLNCWSYECKVLICNKLKHKGNNRVTFFTITKLAQKHNWVRFHIAGFKQKWTQFWKNGQNLYWCPKQNPPFADRKSQLLASSRTLYMLFEYYKFY